MSARGKSVDGQPQGVFVRGSVVRRSRRQIGDTGKSVVTYGISVGESVVDVEDWSEDKPFDVGAQVEIDVRVRAFVTKANRAGVQVERFRGVRGAF